MQENTKGPQNKSGDHGQNPDKDKNWKQNASGKEQQSQKNESGQGSGRNFNSPVSGEDKEQQTGLNKGRQNASANTGGPTDMDKDSQSGSGRSNPSQKSSEITTKRNVTGSDSDGQVSE